MKGEPMTPEETRIERFRRTLAFVDDALKAEGIGDPLKERIINRLVWGHPDGLVEGGG